MRREDETLLIGYYYGDTIPPFYITPAVQYTAICRNLYSCTKNTRTSLKKQKTKLFYTELTFKLSTLYDDKRTTYSRL